MPCRSPGEAVGVPYEVHDRNDSRPHVQRGILRVVVVRPAAPHLGRGLVDLEREDRGRLQLLRVRSARLVPAAGQQLLGERLERAQPLRLVLDEREPPEDHHRVVVRGVLEGRAREHERVHERDRDAGRSARSEQPNGAARGRAVDVDGVADARVEHRDADRLVSVGERHVREQPAIEDRVDRLAVVPALLRPAPHSDATRNVVRLCGHVVSLCRTPYYPVAHAGPADRAVRTDPRRHLCRGPARLAGDPVGRPDGAAARRRGGHGRLGSEVRTPSCGPTSPETFRGFSRRPTS